MRESCTYGVVRGALSNERPYRNHHRTDHIKMADLIGAARRKAGTLSQIGIRIGIRKTRSFYEGIRPNIGVTESIRLTSAELNSHGEE
jgi:hypothetical protein